eukprot:3891048-Rhodomonas_salina.2
MFGFDIGHAAARWFCTSCGRTTHHRAAKRLTVSSKRARHAIPRTDLPCPATRMAIFTYDHHAVTEAGPSTMGLRVPASLYQY